MLQVYFVSFVFFVKVKLAVNIYFNVGLTGTVLCILWSKRKRSEREAKAEIGPAPQVALHKAESPPEGWYQGTN